MRHWIEELFRLTMLGLLVSESGHVVRGLSVPLVGVRERAEARKVEMHFQPNRDVFVALGCVAKLKSLRNGSRMEITLFDLGRTATVQIEGESVPLAGDFTAPLWHSPRRG